MAAVVELNSGPGTAAAYARAALGLIPGFGRSGGALPDVEIRRRGVTVDRAHLAAYDRICGFRLTDTLPATYPHVLAFPLAMRLMTAPDFPLPLIGLVHIANRITVHRPIPAGAALDLSVRATSLRDHPRGRQFDIVATAAIDGAEVWRGLSTYLRLGPRLNPTGAPDGPQPTGAPATSPEPQPTGVRAAPHEPQPTGSPAASRASQSADGPVGSHGPQLADGPAGSHGSQLAAGPASANGSRPTGSSANGSGPAGSSANGSRPVARTDIGEGSRSAAADGMRAGIMWRVPARVGVDYAAVSGDRNPIHTSWLGAKLFGFPRPIAHGMWTKAHALAALEGRLPDAFTVDVTFKKPLLLPASATFTADPATDGWSFTLASRHPHLTGLVTAFP